MKNKIVTKEALRFLLERFRQMGKTIVFTNGCFDILHAGHVRYLQDAKKLGDILVLGLNSDSSVRILKGPLRPIIPENERADVLSALEMINYIIFFSEETPLNLIEYLRPHILVKGGDWSEEQIAGAKEVCRWGGRVVIVPQTPGISTTDVIHKILKIYGKS